MSYFKVFNDGISIEKDAMNQMERAMSLPISVKGALMPDAHMGYGLPIGGVLATRNAVIPYAVGMDIACRMQMSLWEVDFNSLDVTHLKECLQKATFFGVGKTSNNILNGWDYVIEDLIEKSVFVKTIKDKTLAQFGTSGSGNHFASIGEVSFEGKTYLGLMTHSGSRGTGHDVCLHYHNIASKQHPELSGEMKNLAWLNMDSEEGQNYWADMEFCGSYSHRCHIAISDYFNNLALKEYSDRAARKIISNHHNFAWKEIIDGEELIVHRKGATPAREGVLGIVPSNMASTSYIVQGKGNPDSLYSCSHGAGRTMSRNKAKELFSKVEMWKYVEDCGVILIGGGIDEHPLAYKNPELVMKAQQDLVAVVGEFVPKIVIMDGE